MLKAKIHFLRITALLVFCTGLIPQCVSAESISAGAPGYWASGILVGYKGDAVTRGLLFSTREMTYSGGCRS